MSNEEIIKTRHLYKSFGGITALRDVSIEVSRGSIVGLVGPNGSGKTTFLNVLTGIYKPDRGDIVLFGKRVNGLRPHLIARLGVGRTFQIPRLFNNMPVIDNLIATSSWTRLGLGSIESRAKELLEFVGLGDRIYNYASELSGGQQKLLEVARALMSDPAVILMDEPLAGVHPSIKAKIIHVVKELNERDGKTFLIVSHDLSQIKKLCKWVIFMHNGEVITQGEPDRVFSDSKVIEAYLGEARYN